MGELVSRKQAQSPPPGELATYKAPEPKSLADLVRMFQESESSTEGSNPLAVGDALHAFRRWPWLKNAAASGECLKQLGPQARTKREQNLLSSLRRIVRIMQKNATDEVVKTPVSTDWKLVVDAFSEYQFRIPLTQFARFCSRESVIPNEVDLGLVQRFEFNLNNVESTKNVRKVVGKLVTAWNRGVEQIDGWPSQVRIILPPVRDIATPSPEELGPRLVNELALCFDAMQRPSKEQRRTFKPVAVQTNESKAKKKRRKYLSSNTISGYSSRIRLALRIISSRDGKRIDETQLKSLVNPKNAVYVLNTYQESLCERGKEKHSAKTMALAIACIADRYFKVGRKAVETLLDLANQIETDANEQITPQNIERLRAICKEKKDEILRLPAHILNPILKKIECGGVPTPEEFSEARAAVGIAMEVVAPLRISNLAEIEFDKHIKLDENSSTQEARLFFEGILTKNGVVIDRFLPLDVTNLVREYKKTILPVMHIDRASTALFPGGYGTKTIGAGVLGKAISKCFWKYLKLKFNTHLFRHYTAINYLEEHPGEYEVVRLLLGNKNLEVVKRHYTGLEIEAALRRTDTVTRKQKEDAGLDASNLLKIRPSFARKHPNALGVVSRQQRRPATRKRNDEATRK